MNIRAINNLQIYLQKRTEILCSIYISESTRKIAQIGMNFKFSSFVCYEKQKEKRSIVKTIYKLEHFQILHPPYTK